MRTPLPIFQQIRIERIKQGIKQKEMASRLGCSQPNVSRFESGREFGLGLASRMAGILGKKIKISLV